MNLSSHRFKALAVTFGFSFWFFIISSTLEFFSVENFLIFVFSLFIITQILAKKVSKVLDIFAKYNTKIFLGMLHVTIFAFYGISFKILRIDLLRLKNKKESYWLNMEQLKPERIYKQY